MQAAPPAGSASTGRMYSLAPAAGRPGPDWPHRRSQTRHPRWRRSAGASRGHSVKRGASSGRTVDPTLPRWRQRGSAHASNTASRAGLDAPFTGRPCIALPKSVSLISRAGRRDRLRGGEVVSRRAHNPKVAGSNPAPATKCEAPADHRRGLLLFTRFGERTLDIEAYRPERNQRSVRHGRRTSGRRFSRLTGLNPDICSARRRTHLAGLRVYRVCGFKTEGPRTNRSGALRSTG